MENIAKDNHQLKGSQNKKGTKSKAKINDIVKDKLVEHKTENNESVRTKDKNKNVSGFDEWSVSWP